MRRSPTFLIPVLAGVVFAVALAVAASAAGPAPADAAAPDLWLPPGVATCAAYTNSAAFDIKALAARRMKLDLPLARHLLATMVRPTNGFHAKLVEQECDRLAGGRAPEGHEGETLAAYDLDRDGTADIFTIQSVYFGPSLGLVFYGRDGGPGGAPDGGRFRYLYDNSGQVVAARDAADSFTLRFEVTVIEPGEPEIIATLRWDKARRAATAVSLQYLGMQTRLPARLGTPVACRARGGAVALRVTPALTTNRADRASRYEQDYGSKTLRDNVVAEYGADARGFILAREGTWAFVALSPAGPPLRTSLNHGLEGARYDEKTEKVVHVPRIAPWLLGWVKADELR